jgi:hypothetical protein
MLSVAGAGDNIFLNLHLNNFLLRGEGSKPFPQSQVVGVGVFF